MTRPSGYEQLSGDEWQGLCLRVLHEHHPGTDLVEVPDDDRGDAGLEAFSLSGDAYQCYAPEGEPLGNAARYSKQRDKMTKDVGKFIDNAPKLSGMLPAGLHITRWVLLVPRITSRNLLEHAKAQSDRIRDAGLPYATADIVVLPVTLDSFQTATQAVVRRQLVKLHLPPLQEPDYSGISDGLIDTMSNKLAMTAEYRDSMKRRPIVNRLLTNYVNGQAHRAHVGDLYTELGDRLDEELSDLEDRLSMQYALDQSVPDRRLMTILADTERIVEGVLNTRAALSRVIAEGQVADWLMRCPLDFV